MNSLKDDHASRGNLLVCCSAAWEEVAGAKEGRGAEGRETGRGAEGNDAGTGRRRVGMRREMGRGAEGRQSGRE